MDAVTLMCVTGIIVAGACGILVIFYAGDGPIFARKRRAHFRVMAMHKRYWIYEEDIITEPSGLDGFKWRTHDLSLAESYALKKAADGNTLVTIFDTHEELTKDILWLQGAIEDRGWVPLVVPYLPEGEQA